MTDAFIPYGRQDVDERDVAAVTAALTSEYLTTGPAVDAFEAALSQVSGGHPVVAVNSGTAALHAAYAAIGLGPGDEIITTPLTFAATAAAALHLGASVRFADIRNDTWNIDPAAVEANVSERTRAIVAVDYAGQPCQMDRLRELADSCSAVLISDAAHSIGGRWAGRPVGDHADLTCFSFHPVKTVTTGEGGAVVVRQRGFETAVRRFRTHGLVREPEEFAITTEGAWHQEIHELGLNYRLPDINAALGRSQLERLGTFVARRRELVDQYRSALAGVPEVTLGTVLEAAEPAWHLFPVRINDGRRRQVFDRLRARGIGVQVHYLPAYRHPAIARHGFAPGLCPIAEEVYADLLSLPLFPALTDDDQTRVIRELLSALDAA